MQDYDDGDFWVLEQELHLQWVDSEEGREWANRWLKELGAEEVPPEVYAAYEPVELIRFQGEGA